MDAHLFSECVAHELKIVSTSNGTKNRILSHTVGKEKIFRHGELYTNSLM